MYQRVNGKPCHIVWFLKVWKHNKRTQEYDLERMPGFFLTKGNAVMELNRQRVTANRPQYNLYEGVVYKGEVIRERKIMAKDSTGTYSDPEPQEYND